MNLWGVTIVETEIIIRKKIMPDFIPEEFVARVLKVVNDLGDHFAEEPDDMKVLLALNNIRKNMDDEFEAPMFTGRTYTQFTDMFLDAIDARREEIRAEERSAYASCYM